MKFFVVVSAFLVVARAGVIAPIALPAIAAAPSILAAVPIGQHSTQYHSQDALGQYAYGYANDLSAKNEIKSADGQTVGSYSYVDAEGKLQNVQYRADAIHGFRVLATNLPEAPAAPEAAHLIQVEPVKDTAEVAEAKAKHLEALRRAEEDAKKSLESVSAELKSAVQAHPALISAVAPAAIVRPAPAVEFIRSAPILAAPSFSYSYGINYDSIYAFNTYALNPQSIVTAYAAPAPLIAAPIVAEAASTAAQQPAPAIPSDLPEVLEARAKHLAAVESIKKDIENEQKQAKE